MTARVLWPGFNPVHKNEKMPFMAGSFHFESESSGKPPLPFYALLNLPALSAFRNIK
jgi:hypothetical protein